MQLTPTWTELDGNILSINEGMASTGLSFCFSIHHSFMFVYKKQNKAINIISCYQILGTGVQTEKAR